MTVVVENGTGVVGATSYVSETTLAAFALARGVTLVTDQTQLLLSAMDYIEQLYFKGMKMRYDQALQWPRGDVWLDGFYQTPTTLPTQLLNGLMQTAIAIDQGNSPLQDFPRTTKIEKVGDLEVEYSLTSASLVVNRKILNTLQKLLVGGGAGSIGIGKA